VQVDHRADHPRLDHCVTGLFLCVSSLIEITSGRAVLGPLFVIHLCRKVMPRALIWA
jgi:hypothetical protein